MATKVNGTAKPKQSAKSEGRGGAQRIAWIVLVGIVPILVAVVVVGAALQFIGVPVWKTTMQVAGISHTKPGPSPLDEANTKYQNAKQQINSLKSQNATLSAKNQAEQAQIAALETQTQTLQKELQVQGDHFQAGQKESKVLAQMDPQAAAAVLQKLGSDAAGWVVAAMGPDVSGPILQAVPPDFATAVLQKAATDQVTASQSSTNSTTNGTGQ